MWHQLGKTLVFGSIFLPALAFSKGEADTIKQTLLQVEPPRNALLNEVIELVPKEGYRIHVGGNNRCSSFGFVREEALEFECQLRAPGDHKITVVICDEGKVSCRQEDFLVSVPKADKKKNAKEEAAKKKNDNAALKNVHAPAGFQKDLEAAFKEAKKKKKNILLDFSTDNCSPCKELASKVFPKPSFQSATKNLVRIYADSSIDENQEELAHLNLFWTPTLLVLNFKGEEIGRFVGFYPEQEFVARIQRLVNQSGETIDLALKRYKETVKGGPIKDPKIAALAERVGIWYSLSRRPKEAITVLSLVEKPSLEAREELLGSQLSRANEEQDYQRLFTLLNQMLDDVDLRPRMIGWARYYAKNSLKKAKPKLAEQIAEKLLERLEPMIKNFNPDNSTYNRDALIGMEGDAHQILQNRSETKAAWERELSEVEALIDASTSEAAKIDLEFKRVTVLRKMGKDYRAKRSLVDLLDRGDGVFDVLAQAYFQYIELGEPKVAAELVGKMEKIAHTTDERAQAEMYRVKILLGEKKNAEVIKILENYLSGVSLPKATSAWSHFRVKQARRLLSEAKNPPKADEDKK